MLLGKYVLKTTFCIAPVHTRTPVATEVLIVPKAAKR